MTELLIRYPALELCREQIEKACGMMENTFRHGGKLLLCGNGGSCADCEHIAGELLKSFKKERPVDADFREKLTGLLGSDEGSYFASSLQGGLPCISLPSMTAINTAFANDASPEMVYAQLVYALGKPCDMLIGISTSGSSGNVVNAMKVAKAMGISTLALTGNKQNSACARIADVTIKAPASETYLVQELHLPIYHYLCAEVERRFF